MFRARHEAEQSETAVAQSVSRLCGRAVSADEIAALRDEGASHVDSELISGLIRHFGVPEDYLTTNGPRTENVDKQLQLLAAARDAGVKRLALRGVDASTELESILQVLRSLDTVHDH